MRVRKISASPFSIRTVSMAVLMCFWACGANASPSSIIAGYQEIYRMNFEVLDQPGLPSGWLVTSDGYLVAQVSPNHWVYGNALQPGTIVPTELAVGSVIPMTVPQLARVEATSWHSGAYGTERFRSITASKLDSMGVLDEQFAYTPIAWQSGEAGARVWLGDKWYRVDPAGGQTTEQALRARQPYILKRLREKNEPWTIADTQALEDLAREWGFLWRGDIRLTSMREYNDSGSDGTPGASGGSFGGSPGSGLDGDTGDTSGPGWDDGRE